MVNRLVVPLDQSTISESALPLARGLSRQLDLPVSLVTVVDAPASLLRSGGAAHGTDPASEGNYRPTDLFVPAARGAGTPITERDMEKLGERVSEAEQYLRSIADTFPDTIVETHVMYGDPADRILSFSDTRDQPALVMSTHGRSGLGRMMLGSVTARVVQAAQIPMFVVHGSEATRQDGEQRVEKLLIPLDQSSFSAQAIAAVQTIFGSTGLNLVLLHAVETQRARGAYEHPATEDFMQSARQKAETFLEDKASQLRARGHSVEVDLSSGRVAERINASAHTFDVDLIAMSTHGSNAGVRRFVLGSVAEQVLHEADRPLLLIRPQM